MSYVQKVLQPGETVGYRGSIHWLVYLPAIAFLVAAIGAGIAQATTGDDDSSGFAAGAAGLMFFLALAFFVKGWFKRFTTEVAVTDRRVILKHGFIRRQTIEMNMDKVESIDVDQSILGRIFDFGDITVHGTGSGLEPMHMIARPLAFRNAVIAR